MQEADTEMQHCGENVSFQGGSQGTTVHFLGGCNIGRITKPGPEISSTPEECKKPFPYTTWSLLLLLPRGVDGANKAKGREPSFIKHIDTDLILTGNGPLLDSDQ